MPGLLGDTYRVVNDSHAAIVNLSIPFRDGQWDQCHVFSDVAASNLSHTNGDVGGNSSQSACNKWVFDHSTFDSTIATDVRLFTLQGSCLSFLASATGRPVLTVAMCFLPFFSLFFSLSFLLTFCRRRPHMRPREEGVCCRHRDCYRSTPLHNTP